MKRTIESANKALKEKGIDFVSAKEIQDSRIILIDKDYGEYWADIKALCPSMPVPLHKTRRHINKVNKQKDLYIGKEIAGLKILDLFYGPDRGYKNRSFYLEYKGLCGHTCIDTRAVILKHKKSYNCVKCGNITHGVRALVDGIRPKRTPTYNYWVKNNEKFPEKFKDFSTFRAIAGDKPSTRAYIKFIKEIPVWVNLQVAEDKETNFIANAIRQAFRRSDLYKACLNAAKVETDTVTKYRCTMCGDLNTLNKVQVDHIDPIMPIDGTPLLRERLIERIWTDKIQILDRKCHLKKTQAENKIRKQNKARQETKDKA